MADLQEILDLWLEEHLALQQMMDEAEKLGEATEAAYTRIGEAFVRSAAWFHNNTKVAGDA